MGGNTMAESTATAAPSFSPTTAATEGFRLFKSDPMAIVLWFIVMALTTAVVIALVAVLVGFSALAAVPEVLASAQTGEPDFTKLQGLIASMLGFMLVAIPLGLAVQAVLVTAVKRAVLTPEDKAPGYMRLSMDELRTFLVRLVRALIYLGIYVVIGAGGVLLSFVHPILTFFWCLAGFCALIFVSVRLSLAVSQTFVTKRFNLFGSWALTKGRFWPLFLTYLLAGVFMVIIYVAFSLVSMAVGGGSNMNAMMMSGDIDPSAFGVAILVNVVISMIQEALGLPIIGAPPAAAYRDITGTENVFI